jgi:hypothetical protein
MNRFFKILYRYPPLLCFLFLIIAYLPVFLPFFHLKNDLITQNLPTRYFISESLYSGYFPWWNPYIHFGIPQYGDMNTGFWNPLLWIIAKFFGYNIWTITIEEMFYVFIGGWGIFQLLRELKIEKGISLLLALSYMSCGYITGHLQHFCWITGTAFFPYVCLFFLKVNRTPSLKNFILGSFAVFLFVSSTHPGLIIGAFYFFIFSLLFIFIFRKSYSRDFYQPKFWLINAAFFIVSCLFSLVVIVSNVDVLQHISRGTKVSLSESLLHPTSFQSYISVLFPLTVNKSPFFATDISMRNVYTGLSTIVGFILLFKYLKQKALIAVLFPVLFFILLSSGGVFKKVFYYVLPLAGYVRLNGEFTYFVIVLIFLLSAFSLQSFVRDRNFTVLLKKWAHYLTIFCLITGIVVIVFSIEHHSSIFYQKASGDSLKGTIKTVLNNLSVTDLLIVNIFIQLATLFFLVKRYSNSKLIFVLSCNLALITWLDLPFTGLGMESKRTMDKKMTVEPHGIYPQSLVSLNQTAFLDSSLKNELWLLGSYSKKIGYPGEERYPVQLNTSNGFFKDTLLHDFINKQAFVFLAKDTTINSFTCLDSSIIKVSEFGPGHLKVIVNNSDYNFLVFLQNNYPYWEAFVNGKKISHFTVYKTFIGLPLRLGQQEVEFKFNPVPIRSALIASAIIFAFALFILCFPALRNYIVIK